MHPLRATLALACATLALTAPSADAARIKHDLQIDMERRSGGFLASVEFTDGADGTDVPLAVQGGGVTNPIYQDKGISGQNPIYGGGDRAGSPDDFDTVYAITLQFDPVSHLANGGIIHRDLAARNILLFSTLGTYSNTPADTALFSSDGPFDYASAPSVWTLQSDITLYLNGDPLNVGDCWVMRAGSTITATPVPAPATTLLFCAAAVAPCARRRRG